MPTYILFWLFFYPLSILPLCILYPLSSIAYLIINYCVRYRHKVIIQNLINAFPEKSRHEIHHLCNQYYWHLSQLAIEMIKMLAISRANLHRRYHCSNPEIVNRFFNQGKSVILLSSHYNDWEWMVLELDSMFKHHGVGVGKANSNKVFEKLVNRARTRYGTEVVFADTVRTTFEQYESQHIPTAYMMLSDQSPNNRNKCYITDFFHQRTGFIFGGEHFARKYDIPVLYYQVIKEKIGKYRIEVELIAEHPNEMPLHSITQRYTELLESTIRNAPQYWLWSHRRWKFAFE